MGRAGQTPASTASNGASAPHAAPGHGSCRAHESGRASPAAASSSGPEFAPKFGPDVALPSADRELPSTGP